MLGNPLVALSRLSIITFLWFLYQHVLLCLGTRFGTKQITIFLPFFTIEPHFVRKGRKRPVKITIFPQFLTTEPHFVRNCRIFVIARGHRPALRENRNEQTREERERETDSKRVCVWQTLSTKGSEPCQNSVLSLFLTAGGRRLVFDAGANEDRH
jgi:hypothetical protein